MDSSIFIAGLVILLGILNVEGEMRFVSTCPSLLCQGRRAAMRCEVYGNISSANYKSLIWTRPVYNYGDIDRLTTCSKGEGDAVNCSAITKEYIRRAGNGISNHTLEIRRVKYYHEGQYYCKPGFDTDEPDTILEKNCNITFLIPPAIERLTLECFEEAQGISLECVGPRHGGYPQAILKAQWLERGQTYTHTGTDKRLFIETKKHRLSGKTVTCSVEGLSTLCNTNQRILSQSIICPGEIEEPPVFSELQLTCDEKEDGLFEFICSGVTDCGSPSVTLLVQWIANGHRILIESNSSDSSGTPRSRIADNLASGMSGRTITCSIIGQATQFITDTNSLKINRTCPGILKEPPILYSLSMTCTRKSEGKYRIHCSTRAYLGDPMAKLTLMRVHDEMVFEEIQASGVYTRESEIYTNLNHLGNITAELDDVAGETVACSVTGDSTQFATDGTSLATTIACPITPAVVDNLTASCELNPKGDSLYLSCNGVTYYGEPKVILLLSWAHGTKLLHPGSHTIQRHDVAGMTIKCSVAGAATPVQTNQKMESKTTCPNLNIGTTGSPKKNISLAVCQPCLVLLLGTALYVLTYINTYR